MDSASGADDERPPVNVLIVDDRPDNRLAMRSIIEGPDYRLFEAASSADALRILLDEEFALLLIDVVMPGVDGFELARLIKQRPRSASVPIVFLTGQATDVEGIANGYQAGAVDYIVKPLVPEMVRAKVAVFAELHRQRKVIERQTMRLVDSERKENELRLLELRLASERHYRSLAEATPHIVWTARPDGFVDYFNHRWFDYTGVSTEQAVGSWRDAIDPRDRRLCMTAWDEARRTGEMLQVECRVQRHVDGTSRWHLCRAVPEYGAGGQIVAWLGTFTDIEDQKRVESVLSEFKGTLDAVLDAVLIIDETTGRFIYVNQGACALLGYSQAELLSLRPGDIAPAGDGERLRVGIDRSRSGGGATTIEATLVRADRREIPVEISIQTIRIDGGRVVAIARDITARRRAEAEREILYREAVAAIRARDEFLSVASHELRTPLSALQLHLELLVRSLKKESSAISTAMVLTKLESATRQVTRLSRLIADLMDVSRITAGRMQLEPEELDLASVVRDVVGRLSDEAHRVGSALEVHTPDAVKGEWDRGRVEQVVTNLLTNAFKFGAHKPIEVSVAAAGSGARLTVTDHGIGIGKDDAERIFQRYEQAISSRSFGGLGLGLYIARQIVEAHGGSIGVESQPGVGSTFTVELPTTPVLTPERESHERKREQRREADAEAHPDR